MRLLAACCRVARRRRLAIALAVGAAFAAGCGSGSVSGSGEADLRAANAAVVQAGAPGAAVLATGADGSSLGFASGLATVAPGRAMAPGTPQHVGSITKTFTAVLVLQLVDRGLVELDDAIAGYVPAGLVPDADRITIRQLLQHTSGLHDYFQVGTETGPGTVWEPLRGDPSFAYEPEDLVRLGVSAGPAFPPGERYAYSNTGYILLGMIVESLTGATLDRAYGERIFAPLGLRSTAFPTSAGEAIAGEAHCYTRFLDPDAAELEDTSALDPSFAWSAGAIVSTTSDLARFYDALFVRGALLSPESLREMTSSLVPTAQDGTAYGLGIIKTGEGRNALWWHNGSWPGCTATAAVLAEQGVAVAQLQNTGLADQTDALTSAIASELTAAIRAVGGSL
jgi:D-alanyl-D-alanine carboxypeptidase